MKSWNAFISKPESHFPAGAVLIPKTDTKSIITYANDAFVDISVYTYEELLG